MSLKGAFFAFRDRTIHEIQKLTANPYLKSLVNAISGEFCKWVTRK